MGRSQRLFEPLLPYLSITDPLVRFSELTQVAEGQWGPVYAARAKDAAPPLPKSSAASISGSSNASTSRYGTLVAVKTIRVEDENSPKVLSLAQEMSIMADVRHENILNTAGLFVSDDTLWVEMELMERSLADILPLIEEGLSPSEPEVARFAADVLTGIAYLETLNIAHRDVRSDNLLITRDGFVKLADFSQAVVTQKGQLLDSVVPVPPYWMAPEMRLGRPYDPHLVDVWSVGATVWEIIEGSPPFLDIEDPRDFGERWPALRRTDFSVALHQFLRISSEPDDWRPRAAELLESPFIRNACDRSEIVTLLAEVRVLEDGLYDQ
ncbi:kinase-like protein [Clavulina sp. PMI_390]|nr:kinase-like protein [Clavulina sp. PMI_390]